jgi:hypothetical protein
MLAARDLKKATIVFVVARRILTSWRAAIVADQKEES